MTKSTFWSVFSEPFPAESTVFQRVRNAVLFGGFIFLFLWVFQPFGLSEYASEYKVWVCLGYGLVTTGIMLVIHTTTRLLFPHWSNPEQWTVGKNIIYALSMFLFIGTANVLFSVAIGFWSLSFRTFVMFQGITLVTGIFPVVVSTLVTYNYQLRSSMKDAEKINKGFHRREKDNLRERLVQIPSKNKSEKCTVDLQDLLAISAVENYIEVVVKRNGIQRIILRNTLKEVEDALSDYENIMRCHRSHLVNLESVVKFAGNAQGLLLELDESGEVSVPVSRSYVGRIKNALTNA